MSNYAVCDSSNCTSSCTSSGYNRAIFNPGDPAEARAASCKCLSVYHCEYDNGVWSCILPDNTVYGQTNTDINTLSTTLCSDIHSGSAPDSLRTSPDGTRGKFKCQINKSDC
jgi:hypothetical protein